jgi:hypothetical protein
MINRYASLRQGLVGAWCPSLGASGYRLIDRSGYGNHGVLTNMDPGTDWVPSVGKLALDFGSPFTKFINAGTPSLFPNVGFATISAWFLSRNNASQSIVAKSLFGAATGRWWIYTGTGLVGVDGPSGSGLASAQFSTTHANTGWHHILAIFSGTTLSLYYDGVFRSSATVDLIQNSTYSLLFAKYNDGSGGATANISPHNGQIDDIRIYNRALTPNEIRLLYTGGRGVGLQPERIKHRRKTSAAATNRRRRILIGASQ